MKLESRCLPLGTLPYVNIESTTRLEAKLFEKIPYIPVLPKVDAGDNVITRTLSNIPGVIFDDGKLTFNLNTTQYKKELNNINMAFDSPSSESLEEYAFEAHFLEKFFQMIKKFKSPNAVVNLLGPFTIAQSFSNVDVYQLLGDKSFRKLFIQAVSVKALWIIHKIKEINPSTVPVIIFEEPLLGQFGIIKRENESITIDIITTMFSRIAEKLREHGALVGVQCLEKCDWKIPINAGVDIISLDAYNNPNNLCIIPEQITEFLEKGGKINWGIVPVKNETIVKTLNMENIARRLFATMDGLILAGVPANYVYNSALVSTQGDLDHLPVIFAEKALMFAHQLVGMIPIKT